MRTNREE